MESTQTVASRNKALVLEAFDTLFNKRDYVAAERFWSPAYIQHSAIFNPPPIATTVESDLARLTRRNRVIAHVESQIGNHPIIAAAQNHAVSGHIHQLEN